MTQTVSFTTVQNVITDALARWPEHRARTERAASLLILGHVEHVHDHHYAVKSQTRPASQSYVVTPESCACQDRARHANLACKHMIAVRLLEAAEERQRRLNTAWRARFADLSDDEIGRLSQWKRKYAAQPA